MYEDWLKMRYTRLVGDKSWNYVYVATFLNTASKLVIRRSKVQLLLGAVGFFRITSLDAVFRKVAT